MTKNESEKTLTNIDTSEDVGTDTRRYTRRHRCRQGHKTCEETPVRIDNGEHTYTYKQKMATNAKTEYACTGR